MPRLVPSLQRSTLLLLASLLGCAPAAGPATAPVASQPVLAPASPTVGPAHQVLPASTPRPGSPPPSQAKTADIIGKVRGPVAVSADIIGKVRGPVALGAAVSAYRLAAASPTTAWVALAGVQVTLTDERGRPAAGIAPIISDAQGNFVFHGLPRGWKGLVSVKARSATLLSVAQAADRPTDVTPATTAVTEHLESALAEHPNEIEDVSLAAFDDLAQAVEADLASQGGEVDLSTETSAARAFDQVASQDPALVQESQTLVTAAAAPHVQSVVLAPDGTYWVADVAHDEIEKRDATGQSLGRFHLDGTPQGLALDPEGNLWVTCEGSETVAKFGPSGTLLGSFAVVGTPRAIAIDAHATVWVAGWDNGEVVRLDPTGNILGQTAVGANPSGLALDAQGNLWVACETDGTVVKLDPDGQVLGTFGVAAGPTALAIAPSGDVWVAHRGSNRASKLDASGQVLGEFPVGNQPEGIAVDALGRVWVASYQDSRLDVLADDGSPVAHLPTAGAPFAILLDHGRAVLAATQTERGTTAVTLDAASVPAPAPSPANVAQP